MLCSRLILIIRLEIFRLQYDAFDLKYAVCVLNTHMNQNYFNYFEVPTVSAGVHTAL